MSQRIYYSKEAQEQAQREKLMLLVLVAGLSVSISTLIALLFAPASGDEVRQQMNDTIDDVLTKSRDHAEKLSEDLNERIQKVNN